MSGTKARQEEVLNARVEAVADAKARLEVEVDLPPTWVSVTWVFTISWPQSTARLQIIFYIFQEYNEKKLNVVLPGCV